MFRARIQSVFKKLNWKAKGAKIDKEYLNHLRFAHNIKLITHKVEKLQDSVLNELNEPIAKQLHSI